MSLEPSLRLHIDEGTAPPPNEAAGQRIESVDLLRGVIMILMAIDHTRDFFGTFGANPTDLATTTAPLFFTRWVTHFCAPVFFLLTGTGAGLSRARKGRAVLSRYLITRGALLIVLELTLVRGFAYQFNFDYHVTLLLVLWALGWAMIFLGCVIFLPMPAIAGIGGVMVLGHNLLDPIRSANPLWIILHGPGFVLRSPDHTIFAAYPLVPWIGVTALGFVLATVYSWPAERRRAQLLAIGLAASLGFVVLRLINVYGDPVRWAVQNTSMKTLLSFLNTNKYPPSLLFLLMTLGPALLFLRWVDGATPKFFRPALVYGREPFAYYVVHFALIHILAVLFTLTRFGTAHWMFESPNIGQYPFTPPPGWGFSLPVVYAVWISVVLLMYPLCRKIASYRAQHHPRWMRYF